MGYGSLREQYGQRRDDPIELQREAEAISRVILRTSESVARTP